MLIKLHVYGKKIVCYENRTTPAIVFKFYEFVLPLLNSFWK